MIIFGNDFETTGFDLINDRIVEAGFALWKTEAHAPVFAAGCLVKPDGSVTPERWKEAEDAAHRISWEDAERFGFDELECLEKLCKYMALADVAAAHNGTAFDKILFENACRRRGLTPPDILWLDTRTDLGLNSNRLVYIAADHGFVNPFPHRALTDVLTMLKILDQYDVAKVVELARIPNVCLQALVSFDDRQKAKDGGYRWRGNSKRWLKLVKANRMEEEVEFARLAGFNVRQVEREE